MKVKGYKKTGILLGLLSSAAFGFIPFFSIPLMENGMGKPSIMFYRFLFSIVFMTPIFIIDAIRRGDLKCSIHLKSKNTGKFVFILICTGIFFAITSLCLIESYSYIPSGVTITIHFLYPVLVAAIMMYIFKDKNSRYLFPVTLLSFIGVSLLCWTYEGNLNLLGIVFSLITVVTYALYFVGIEMLSFIPPLVLTFCILFVGVIVFGIYAISTTGIESINSSMEWTNLIVLALFLTVASDYFLILAIKYVDPTIISILGVMEPAVAYVMGILALNDFFSVLGATGLMLVLISVVIAIKLTSKSKKSIYIKFLK